MISRDRQEGQQPLRLLLVEDCDDDAELLDLRLRRSGLAFDMTRVETEQDFRRHIATAPDLVLSDYALPRFGAMAALDILLEQGLDTPLIIVSGAMGEESAVAAMKRGATDYLLKDRLVRLRQAIEQAVDGARLRKQLRAKQGNLAHALQRLERLSQQLVGAQEQERKNLARELHDELGQRLTVLNLSLHRLQPFLAGREEAMPVWRDAEHEVSLLIRQVRALSVSLRPPMLDHFGLELSIRQLIDRQCAAAGLDCVLEYAGVPVAVPEAVEITAYRLVQEGLTNIVRHARASKVVIEINGGESGAELEIVVRDNGRGFDDGKWAGPDVPGHGGLLGMRERVELLGGQFRMNSQPGQGTRIVALLPLQNKDYENNQGFSGR